MKKGNENITDASRILGNNFIAPDELSVKGITYTHFQREVLAGFIPNQEKIRRCKATGCAVIALPPASMSLLGIRTLIPGLFYSKTGGWYAEEKQRFAHKDKTGTGWLICKKNDLTVFNDDISFFNWNQDSMRVPNAAEVVWCVIAFFLTRKVRILERFSIQTSSRDAYGGRVLIGPFKEEGLYVGAYMDVFKKLADMEESMASAHK